MNIPDIKAQTELEHEVIKTLLYFDIFKYPLKADEVYRYLRTNTVTQDEVAAALRGLSERKYIFSLDAFYSTENNPGNAERRRKGNELALKLMPFARKRGQFISKFPFVRAVMASGSFSKDYMDEQSDLDFFIVTEPGKLWIARTLLVLYKRIALFNSHKYFCVNYLVDEANLEIEEKNLFTATELATLIPLQNAAIYRRLLASNPWLTRVFPNFTPRDVRNVQDAKNLFFKRVFEFMLRPFATRLERMCMSFTLNRFYRIYQKQFSEQDFLIAFKSKKYASKNHPKNYQKKVMDLYHEKMNDFFKREQILGT
jgi:hypothetical protein